MSGATTSRDTGSSAGGGSASAAGAIPGSAPGAGTSGSLLDMRQVRVDPLWALRVPPSFAVRRQLLPFSLVDGEVQVACASLADAGTLKALERYIEKPLRAVLAEPDSLRKALQRVHGDPSTHAGAAEPESPAGLVHELLHAARLREASDIHLDPTAEGVRVRLRVDGRLEEYRRIPSRQYPELLTRVKVMGGLDIAEKRAPQDGRFTQEFSPEERVDVRLATLPTRHGERATLRLLARQGEGLTLERLGMSARDRLHFERAIERPHGLILATGPTGSGKTTTLYAALRRIVAASPVNVITVEDPVEVEIPGVAQVEVDPAQKVSFAKALRSILRHDPDVILIAEIRDQETVDIAIKAALTGHLVLATLHTNSAASAVTRLDDMGVPRFLTAATLRLAMAQRLVRRLCPRCRREEKLTAEDALRLGLPEAEGRPAFAPVGCVYCAGRGYSGRAGLFELLALDEEDARAVAKGLDEAAILRAHATKGGKSLLDDALEKLHEGVTSLPEILEAVAV